MPSHDHGDPKCKHHDPNVPTALIFKKKRYHGCSICISGVVSERYTDPTRKLPRDSSDMFGFIKFRSNIERDMLASWSDGDADAGRLGEAAKDAREPED